MRLLMVSLDRKAFDEGSEARARLAGYGEVFDEVHVIAYALRSLGLRETRIAPNVTLHPTNSRTKLGYIPDAIRMGKRLAADAVSAQDCADTGAAAWRIAHAQGALLQLQDHADVFDPYFIRESSGNLIRALIARLLLPKADCVRAVLPRVKERIEAAVPRVRGRVSVLPVFVDTARYEDATPTYDLHERYPQFDRIVLMASRLVPQKDLGLALRAFARAKVAGVGLVILGEGREKDRLREEAERLRISERVVFAPWESDLASAYCTADLFLLSSRYESYCRTLVEATAAGLPFVATDVGVARLLAEQGAGIVVPVGDEAALAKALGAALLAQRPPVERGALDAVHALTGATETEYRARFGASFDNCMNA